MPMTVKRYSFEITKGALKYAIEYALAQTKAYPGVAYVYLTYDGFYVWQWTGAPDTARTVCVVKNGSFLKMGEDATPEEVEYINSFLTKGKNPNA